MLHSGLLTSNLSFFSLVYTIKAPNGKRTLLGIFFSLHIQEMIHQFRNTFIFFYKFLIIRLSLQNIFFL